MNYSNMENYGIDNIQFAVNKQTKKELGRKVWYGSTCGKIWIGIAIVLIIVGIAIWVPLYNGALKAMNTAASALVISIAVEAIFALLAFFSLILSNRQLNKNIKMRGQEELFINQNVLAYKYHVFGGWANPIDSGMSIWLFNLINIDLSQTRIEYKEKLKMLKFIGGISLYGRTVIVGKEYEGPMAMDSFVLHAYFEPDLVAALRMKVDSSRFIEV